MSSPFRSASFLAALAGSATLALAQNGGYTSTFDDPAGTQWSDARQATAPKGERFLGTFGNESVKLALENLPDHTHVVIALDLYIIGPWGGIGPLNPEGVPQALAHEWSMVLDGSTEPIVRATFSNDDTPTGRQQSYPDAFDIRNPARRGAFKVNELGYADPFSLAPRDSVYRLYFTVKHSGPVATFTFAATGLSDDTAQRWGIDNVAIETYDMTPIHAADLEVDAPLPGGGLVGGGGSPAPVGPQPPFNPPGGSPPPGGGGGSPPPPPPPPLPPTPSSMVPTPGAATLLALGGLTLLRRRRPHPRG